MCKSLALISIFTYHNFFRCFDYTAPQSSSVGSILARITLISLIIFTGMVDTVVVDGEGREGLLGGRNGT